MKRPNVSTMQRIRDQTKTRILDSWFCQSGSEFTSEKVSHALKVTRESAALYLSELRSDGFLTADKRHGNLYYRKAPERLMRKSWVTHGNNIPIGRYFP